MTDYTEQWRRITRRWGRGRRLGLLHLLGSPVLLYLLSFPIKWWAPSSWLISGQPVWYFLAAAVLWFVVFIYLLLRDRYYTCGDHPLQSLRATDAADVVFYVGTFSKCILPSLRLGFVVVPSWARRTLVAAKNCLDWHCSTPLQTGVSGFIREGHLARHIRKMRQIYSKRRQLLYALLRRDFADCLEPIPSLYGMHVAAWARDGVDLDAAVQALAGRGVKIHTLRRYHLGQSPRPGLVFGYGVVDLAEIERGLAALQRLLLH